MARGGEFLRVRFQIGDAQTLPRRRRTRDEQIEFVDPADLSNGVEMNVTEGAAGKRRRFAAKNSVEGNSTRRFDLLKVRPRENEEISIGIAAKQRRTIIQSGEPMRKFVDGHRADGALRIEIEENQLMSVRADGERIAIGQNAHRTDPNWTRFDRRLTDEFERRRPVRDETVTTDRNVATGRQISELERPNCLLRLWTIFFVRR